MKIDPFYFPKMLPNMAAAHIALHVGAKGYNNTVITACAAGTQAIGDALDLVRAGRADVVIAGGTEAALCEIGLAGFAVIRALSSHNDEPQKASRPFDADRDGFVAAEAAGHLRPREPGARPQARRADPRGAGRLRRRERRLPRRRARAKTAKGAANAMTLGARRRGRRAGGGRLHQRARHLDEAERPVGDAGDQARLRRGRLPRADQRHEVDDRPRFRRGGRRRVGRRVQSIQTGMIHPTINYEHPDPDCDLDYVPNEARRVDVDVVLKNSFGFGGQNACLVFKRFEE